MSACINLYPLSPPALRDVSEVNRAGRIESYLHSDAITPNKGGALVKVTCATDFAARTDPFIRFARKVAQLAYAASATNWDAIVASFPEMADDMARLRLELKERIEVTEIKVMQV